VRNVDLSGSRARNAGARRLRSRYSFFKAFAEVFLDARREAAAAHKRYPFADW
jgi:hypothetical protein